MTQEKFDIIKLQIKGKATPAPPVGPALGQKGVNIQKFCKLYNEINKDKDQNATFPVIIKVAKDKSFTITVKEQPVAKLLLQAVNLSKGSKEPGRTAVGKLTMREIREIAEKKMNDMGVEKIESAEKVIAGTARSMGITIVENS
jgi:large subunit ribosomal protein L11